MKKDEKRIYVKIKDGNYNRIEKRRSLNSNGYHIRINNGSFLWICLSQCGKQAPEGHKSRCKSSLLQSCFTMFLSP